MEKTKKVLFGEILAIEGVAQNEELVAFVNHELELLSKKGSSKKPTKAQEENVAIKATILEVLSICETPRSIKDLQAEFTELAGFSNQKVSALLKQLIDEVKVVRTEEKRVALFALVSEEEEEEEEEETSEDSEEEEISE